MVVVVLRPRDVTVYISSYIGHYLTMALVRGIRGATTASVNTNEAIVEASTELLVKLVETIGLRLEDLAAVFFTTTQDLNAEFPAQAARKLGWEYVALMDGHEMAVPGSLSRCIRVLLLVNTDKSPSEISNVYLRGAVNLRNRGGGPG